jgi:hypothetical protein
LHEELGPGNHAHGRTPFGLVNQPGQAAGKCLAQIEDRPKVLGRVKDQHDFTALKNLLDAILYLAVFVTLPIAAQGATYLFKKTLFVISGGNFTKPRYASVLVAPFTSRKSGTHVGRPGQ